MQPGTATQPSPELARKAAIFALQNLGNKLPGINQSNSWENYTSRDTLPISSQIRLAKQDIVHAKARHQEVINRTIDRQCEEAKHHDLQLFGLSDGYRRDEQGPRSSKDGDQDPGAQKEYERVIDEEILKSSNALHTEQIGLLMRAQKAQKTAIRALQARVGELEATQEVENHRARKALPRTLEEFVRLQELDMQLALEVGKYLQGNADTKNTLMKKYETEMEWSQEDADALIQAYEDQAELRLKVRTLVQAKSNTVDPRNR